VPLNTSNKRVACKKYSEAYGLTRTDRTRCYCALWDPIVKFTRGPELDTY
jgi:hypothetical protein